MKMRRRVLGLLQIMNWTRKDFFCPRSSGSFKDRTEMIRLVDQIAAARSFAPLPHEFGRGPQTDLNNVPADPIQFTLERVIPERPTVCGRVC